MIMELARILLVLQIKKFPVDGMKNQNIKIQEKAISHIVKTYYTGRLSFAELIDNFVILTQN